MFAGFSAPDAPTPIQIAPRGVRCVDLRPGDLLRIECADEADRIALLAFTPDGRRAEEALSLGKPQVISAEAFDADAFEAHGGGAHAGTGLAAPTGVAGRIG